MFPPHGRAEEVENCFANAVFHGAGPRIAGVEDFAAAKATADDADADRLRGLGPRLLAPRGLGVMSGLRLCGAAKGDRSMFSANDWLAGATPFGRKMDQSPAVSGRGRLPNPSRYGSLWPAGRKARPGDPVRRKWRRREAARNNAHVCQEKPLILRTSNDADLCVLDVGFPVAVCAGGGMGPGASVGAGGAGRRGRGQAGAAGRRVCPRAGPVEEASGRPGGHERAIPLGQLRATARRMQKQWEQLIDRGTVLQDKLIDAAEKAYVEVPNADREVADLLIGVLIGRGRGTMTRPPSPWGSCCWTISVPFRRLPP